MKKYLTFLFALGVATVHAQSHSLVKLWETDSVVAIPESVLPDLKTGILYLSLINGGPWDADVKVELLC